MAEQNTYIDIYTKVVNCAQFWNLGAGYKDNRSAHLLSFFVFEYSYNKNWGKIEQVTKCVGN